MQEALGDEADLIFRYPDGEPVGDRGRTFQVVLKNRAADRP
jgi:hypothetical protein